MLKNKEDIKAWLDKYGIQKYNINEDMTVDVDGDVDLSQKQLTSIAVQFNVVTGFFDCSTNKLTTLEGCPAIVDDDFLFYSNKVTSLLHGPQYIGKDYNGSNNPLTSVNGCPVNVGRDINLKHSQLTELVNFNSDFNGLFYHSGTIIQKLENHYSLTEYPFNAYEKLSLELNHADLKAILFYDQLNTTIGQTQPTNNSHTKKLKI